MNKFKKVARKSQVLSGGSISVQWGEDQVAIFNINGTLYAVQDHCPHRGAPLSGCPVSKNVVTCTWHGWEFDLKKGTHILDPNIQLKRFPIKVRGDDILISN